MQSQEYQEFTATLLSNLEADWRVIGLVALGSMARQDYAPDRWSDHDFFVIVEAGAQEALRTDLKWLPRYEEVALYFRETAHGLKVVYTNGHLLEFAVFDPEELALARINRYRVLLDRAELEPKLKAIAEATFEWSKASFEDDDKLFGMFLTNMLVGVGRYHRGEKISGHQFVKTHALSHLLTLLKKYLPGAEKAVLDNLDPFRRFERAYPELGQEVNRLLLLEVPAAALGLLELAERELKPYLYNYPSSAVVLIKQTLSQN